ncbi:hypothetical protein CLAFUW4_10324 [Fulvia fulva]|uniref:Large ribosomal subunit protein bL34m n=1 Tax=Passalora fulva TaxID=5499 RepID=A0A9Q8LFV3_PASFU|nr:uncharacterized protein CLAFUR5_04937 [Fulvia fulva]KAK4615858.1 hypothetical protein CLAFUR4_10328 [Fulvia fulva]KAK4616790.1 hypothetical protein CLAFUR0_10326 [Fulvia fulva]UJO16630.1 hypothetical protein CLAFUR5_04937 [Fulvia fulva]WPV19672.1 hypothetical protein CLAFUW4_10324 [Fulvia fulva]WPV33920.1 hypothetical protein CLAFUW7_10324 [Fulvia fulva]
MLCLRCLRAPLERVSQSTLQAVLSIRASSASQSAQKRSFGVLSSLPSRPTIFPARPSLPASEVQATTLQPTSQPGLSALQVRGAKRDTFKPSHVVRKRRHGFLSRLRTRTGRMILKRRRMKGRNTLSH